jgi:hypothetical protein
MRVVTNHADQNKKQKEIIMSNTKKKETARQGAAAQLFALVTELTRPNRRYFLNLLLWHAFISGGTNAYLEIQDWNTRDRLAPCLRLQENVSPELADAWLYWAEEIGRESPSRETCRVAILELVRELIRWDYFNDSVPVGLAYTGPLPKERT